MKDLGFIHTFVPGCSPGLLLLHGTGGNQEDLIPLGRVLLAGAALLGVRGKAIENGMPRFFRRLAEGVFDLDDLKLRTEELARFIEDARLHYGVERMVAVGYSNGANIAASLLLREPRHLAGAVLFRAMVPFKPAALPDLSGMPLFLSAGERDPIVPAENVRELAAMFQSAGADVAMHWHPGGHELGPDDIDAARLWLTKTLA